MENNSTDPARFIMKCAIAEVTRVISRNVARKIQSRYGVTIGEINCDYITNRITTQLNNTQGGLSND